MTLRAKDLCIVCRSRPKVLRSKSALDRDFCKPCAAGYLAAIRSNKVPAQWLATRIHAIHARETAKLRKALEQQCDSVLTAVQAIDALHHRDGVDAFTHGRAVAAVMNALELSNDSVRYNVLGVDYRKDKKVVKRPVDVDALLKKVGKKK